MVLIKRMAYLFLKALDLCFFYFLGSVAYARRQGVVVGDGCRIYIKEWGSEPFLIKIGSKVTITSGVRIITHDGSTWLFSDDCGERYQKYAGVVIGDRVFIGVNTVVLPGVTIGSRVVIGAGSVITKDIPDDSIAVGNPARVIGSFEALEVKIKELCVSDKEISNIKSYKERVLKAIQLQEGKKGK